MGAAAAAAPTRSRWGWVLWVTVAAAVILALVIGSSRPGGGTLDQRTRALAGQVRCPVCSGESAAESQVPAAAAIRQQIHQELASGTPSQRVLADLVRVYGTGILEKPQARGFGLLVWVLPVVAVVGAGAGLVLAFARWRRMGAQSAPPRARAADQALVAEALEAERLRFPRG